MKKILGLASASVGIVLAACTAGCVAPTSTPGEPAPVAKSAEGLTITEETETTLVGYYVRGDSVVTFEARLATPILKTKLVVNGAVFDYERDIVKSTLTIDGHASTILQADSVVLGAFEKALDKVGNPTKMREALYKTVALMSAAPRGTTIKVRHITPTVELKEQNRSYCDNDDGITYVCCANAGTGCSGTYAGANGSNPIYNAPGVAGVTYGTNVYGGYVSNCQSTPSYTHEHEVCEASASSDHESGQGSYHGRVTWGSRCGWSASACEGRCGAGCPQSYNFYVTKDCLDHDVCANNHPSASTTSTFGDCGNEFDRASGDFTYGTGSGFASGCGFYMWGDNTR